MKFFDYIRFALKNIWRQKLRTVLTIFAIIIGATSVVAMLSLVFGAKQAILGQIEASGALTQVNITGSTDTTDKGIFDGGNGGDHSGKKLDDALATSLAGVAHVTSVTPIVGAYSFNKIALKGSDAQYSFNQVQGYKPSAAADKKLAAGRNLTPTDKAGKIVVGSSIATRLGFEKNPGDLVGKTVSITMQKGYTGEGADVPKPPEQGQFSGPMTKAQQEQQQKAQQEYQQQTQNLITVLDAEVIGVTEPGFDDASYISLDWARGVNTYRNWQQDPVDMERYQKEQDALNHNAVQGQQPKQPTPAKMILTGQDQIETNGYDTLVLKVDDANAVEDVAKTIRDTYKVGAITAKDTLATILNSFKIITLVLGIIGAISLLVAAIGVVNTMVMATLERTREIGVMRACGATKAAVRRLFTFEAALLGFWGGLFGVLLGIGLGKIANIFAADRLASVGGANIIQVPAWLGITVVIATTIVGILAGMYPAFRAARMNPVEALRYE